VVKIPNEQWAANQREKGKEYRQAKLEALGGVVVIEDILRSKNVLDATPINLEEALSSLSYLQSKNPSKEILKSTGIGKTVHKLCRHPDEQIATLAKQVYDKWKKAVVAKATKPMIEVRSDLKTEEFRLTARKWLNKSLGSNQDQLAELVEREIFHLSKRLIKGEYRKTVRRIVFALRKEDIREKLTTGKITAKELISVKHL